MNPYEVLGIPSNATDEQVKEAYKELVKKYHPDKYQDNPLSDLAEEKLQEINRAYDQIMNERGSGGSSYGYGNSSAGGDQGWSNSGGAADYAQVRRNIDAGNIAAAETILNNASDRSAEWFFLSGVIAQRKGWYDEAMNKLQTACSMEPANMEYRRHLASLRGRGGQYQNTATGKGYGGNNDLCCQALQCYICADCCCDCI
jgi:molecular chaperone DnaJ